MATTETAHSAASASQSATDKAGAAQSRQSSRGRKASEAPPPGSKADSKADSGPASTGGPGAPTANPASDDLPVTSWDDMMRRGTALRLLEHLNVGVQLAADLGKDPAFSADDRLQAVLVAARMITANAHLGRAIGYLAQVEQRRRTVVQRIDPPAVWSGSNFNPEVLLERELFLKMLRYMKAIADETFDPAIAEAEAAEKAAKDEAAKNQPAKTGTARADGASAQA